MAGRTSGITETPHQTIPSGGTGGGHDGESWMLRRPSRQLRKSQWRSIGSVLDLSTRQLEIVRCIFDGLDEESISRELRISHHTVHTYLDRLYKKLRVKSRCEVVVRVFLAYVSHRPRDRCAKYDASTSTVRGR